MIVETKNRKLRILVRIKMNFVGFLHIHCMSFPGSVRFQTSQHFLQLDWVISCQGHQVVSIEHVRDPEPLSARNSTHKAIPKLITHIINHKGKEERR